MYRKSKIFSEAKHPISAEREKNQLDGHIIREREIEKEEEENGKIEILRREERERERERVRVRERESERECVIEREKGTRGN